MSAFDVEMKPAIHSSTKLTSFSFDVRILLLFRDIDAIFAKLSSKTTYNVL